jgi:hypothetical protein
MESVTNSLERLRNRSLPLLAAGLFFLLLIWVLLAPAESRLGNLVKLVYVHGALVWTGLLTFSLAGLLGLVALGVRFLGAGARSADLVQPEKSARLLVRTGRAGVWYHGTESAGLAALVVWIIYVVSAMLVTGLTWGQVIAWNEPRVRATGLILVAAIVLFVVERLVSHRDFTAAVNVLMGLVPWIVVAQADVIRHPVDPIGGSGSAAIQGFYWLILLTVAGLAATFIAWLWVGAELRELRVEEGRL